MVKSEFIAKLATEFPHFNQRQVESMVEFVLRTMSMGLASGKRVEIRGLCSLHTKHIKPRIAMNPQSRKPIQTRGRKKIYYRASKLLRKTLNPDIDIN